MKQIEMYSTPSCHFCNMAKEFFKKEGIEYTVFDVSKDQDKKKEMIEKSGQMGVPVFNIGNDIVIGFNKTKILELIK